MRARVLGSAAGGGVPQWNCACDNCRLVRAGDARVRPRTQDSIAVQAGGGDRWLLVNASPDVLRQVEQFDALWPRVRRSTPIAAVALTNG
ncbi:MAG TPA: pyrroloquinoline quinone biosynthesis protein PqqB, partial [Polyangiaceae bacterium]|nr:pyrroloquinoline quinone biosynthesis protein PqqB [Polyangiaceae bacterium]